MPSPSANKPEVVIATHNGEFHADDLMACAIAKRYLTAMGLDVKIIRTRDQTAIDKADIAIDVGGVHEPGKLRFDHHQDRQSKVASAGMLLNFFRDSVNRDFDGLSEVVGNIDRCDLTGKPCGLAEKLGAFNPTWEEDPKTADKRFEEALNVLEEGMKKIEAYPPEYDGSPRKEGEDLSQFIERKNRSWNLVSGSQRPQIDRSELAAKVYGHPDPLPNPSEPYIVPMDEIGRTGIHNYSPVWAAGRGNYATSSPQNLEDALDPAVRDRAEASKESNARGRAQVEQAVLSSKNPDIVEIPNPALPWREAFTQKGLDGAEAETSRKLAAVNYVHFKTSAGAYGSIAIARPDDASTPKTPFPEEWRGKRGAELVDAVNKSFGKEVTSIPSGANPNDYFCHPAGFFLGSGDRDTMSALMKTGALASLRQSPDGQAAQLDASEHSLMAKIADIRGPSREGNNSGEKFPSGEELDSSKSKSLHAAKAGKLERGTGGLSGALGERLGGKNSSAGILS